MIPANFWERVDMSGGAYACWPWMGARTGGNAGGYGALSVGRKNVKAHRLALAAASTPFPSSDALCALHHCDNRACCNPLHLYWGTRQDNSDDARIRHRIDHDKNRGLRSAHFVDLSGARFGRMVAESFDGVRFTKLGRRSGAQWLCRCDCGTVKSIPSHDLRQGKILSCGCLRRDRKALASRILGGK